MPDLYLIADWDALFEVNAKNGAWTVDQAKRKGSLPYVRIQTRGGVWTVGYRTLLRVAGTRADAVYGLYVKLVELAGSWPAEHRGAIWKKPGIPATIEEIADELTGFSPKSVAKSLEVLIDERLAWVSVESFPESQEILESRAPSRTQDKSIQDQYKSVSSISTRTKGKTQTEGWIDTIIGQESGNHLPQEIVDTWNKVAETLALPKATLTETRKKSIKTRMKDPYFQEHWVEAIKSVPNLPPFWLGRDSKKYKITLDKFLTPDMVERIISEAEAHSRRPPEPGMPQQDGEAYLGEDNGT